MRWSTSSSPVLVGLMPTPVIVTSEPGTMVAATMKNAAAEKSPGTDNVGTAAHPTAGLPSTDTVSPSRLSGSP
jgi:hypothetical protein